MAHKCALIVDDSRTARQVLGEMLAANRLRVETASSAEEALEYLRRSRPDVIFMDHLMPGMDGLQAVQAIKSNPATATIPIMMYTSQAGEVYVGQARALGAVGVLPKQIKAVEVSEVLRSLRLVDDEAAPEVAEPPVQIPRDLPRLPDEGDRTDLRRWLREQFEGQTTALRADVEATVSRLLGEQVPQPRPAAPLRSWLTPLLVLTLTVLAGAFFWLHLDTQRKWRAAVEQNTSLMAAMTVRRASAAATAANTVRQLDAERDAVSSRSGEFVRALEWGVNQSATFPPGAEPFDSRRLETLRGLLERLATLGFTGVVQLDSHVGDFCYVRGPDDSLMPAPDSLPATDCARIGLGADEARSVSARQSVVFASFLGTRTTDAAVRIEIVPHGNAAPRVPYPADPQGLTAGEWNAIARENQRVSVTLWPDTLLP